MNLIRTRGPAAIGPDPYLARSRQIRDLVVLSPILFILMGLLVLVAGSERTQAQGPAQTLPSVKVAFIGDAGMGGDARKVLKLVQRQGADFVLHQGDFAYGNEDAAAAREWNDQVNAVLGANYPYFGAVGNHDNSAWPTYQGLFQDRLNRNPDAVCQQGDGGYGVNTACRYKGIFFILSGVGTRGSGHVEFIQDQLAGDGSTWSICTWHKNQQAMQVGGKGDEVGWGAYEACREGGAIIATGHEHSYSRTKTLTSMQSQTVDPDWPAPNDLRVSPGSTFAFVSGLGGDSVRDQQRCRPTSYPYGCNAEWASIYTSNQGARAGALFITFNVAGDANQALGQFIDVKGKIVDEFMITADSNNASGNNTTGNNTPPAGDDQRITTDEDTPRAFTLTGSDADGDPVSFSVLNGPDSGSLIGTSPDLTYTPDADFSGPDSFTFVANDGAANSAPATVSITVTPVNDAPLAGQQSVGVTEGKSRDITLSGGDVDGDPLTFTVLTDPAGGSLSGNPPNVTYTPNDGFIGDDSFTFIVSDGSVASPPATVGITVSPRIAGQGLKLSRNSDFSTTDTVFDYGETVYFMAWSDRVDFNNIKKSEWKLEKMKGSLTNNRDMTYTGQVVNDEHVKKVKEQKSDSGKVEIRLEDGNGRKIKISQSFTLNGPGA